MEPLILALGWIVSFIVLAITLRIVNRRIEEKQIPLMAVLAAGIFVAQMINFPIGGGTTGHLVGAALAAILLGPYAALIVISTILVIQCLIFGDGGITALGLNIMNMGIIGCFLGWYVFRMFQRWNSRVAIFMASWAAVFVGALVCALELTLSYSLSNGAFGIHAQVAIPSMLAYHVVIGIGEGIITTGVIAYLYHASPEILRMPKVTLKSKRGVAAQ
jgi:cobalt/nickel transport system permease protein